ncbi:MAG: hypothetical protein ABFD98_07280 [Syntrophobacteraceae bacterium]|nr:hypothetical protein [Desulfobacteraceae bacterium]
MSEVPERGEYASRPPRSVGPVPPPAILEKIETARKLFEEYGALLRADARVAAQLECARRKIERSRKANVESGVAAACRRCDEEEGGSCCGAGIENRYTPVLLLANLLMGKNLPLKRRSENDCHFLGETGCSLDARHVLCVNYLCTRIQKELPARELIRLQNIIGEEMDAVFLLHETIKKTMKSAGT